MAIASHYRSWPVTSLMSLAALLLPSVTLAADACWSRDDAAHLLRRAAFGGTPEQVDRVHAMGRDAAVEYLVTGKLPAGAPAPFAHADLPPFSFNPDFKFNGQPFELEKLRAWWLDRMVRSDRPLEEKMTLFWHGLFTSGVMEVQNIHWMGAQNFLFHREPLGNYKQLTRDILHDAAMLRYLNNDQNVKGRPNENLARELMELFTMGEGNGYTEKDIPEVARALTGMTVQNNKEESEFVPRNHDDGPKTIFGKTGNFMPDDVVELIFDRAEPAKYLAMKLWQFFGSPEPTEDDIVPVAEALRKGNWEVTAGLRVLFRSPAFYAEPARFGRMKSPVELEAMTLRLLEEPAHERIMLAAAFSLEKTGQQLFQPPNVKGWPGERHWITGTTLFARYAVGRAMASGEYGSRSGDSRFFSYGQGRRPGRVTAPTTLPAAGKRETDAERQARAMAEQEARQRITQEKIREAVELLPPMPPADEVVSPVHLFARLGSEPTASQLVDAAVARFLQRPLDQETKTDLIRSLGIEPLLLGETETDQRVRQMLGLLLSLPEYQVE